jgi:hypothetical protein
MEPVDIPVAPDVSTGPAETVDAAPVTSVGVTLAKELEAAITPALVLGFRMALLVETTLVVERELVEEEVELEEDEELLLDEVLPVDWEVVVAVFVGLLEEVVGAASELELGVGEDA